VPALPTLNLQTITRQDYLKSEIQKFLKDKELLRSLESSNGDEMTISLLRDEIMGRSHAVETMCKELKQLKRN
jgi:hypothetical protein